MVEVDFGNTKKNGMSRMDHVVVGKGKKVAVTSTSEVKVLEDIIDLVKGGLHLQKETRLCTIRCKDGKEIVIRAGVKGVLAEVSIFLSAPNSLLFDRSYFCEVFVFR